MTPGTHVKASRVCSGFLNAAVNFWCSIKELFMNTMTSRVIARDQAISRTPHQLLSCCFFCKPMY